MLGLGVTPDPDPARGGRLGRRPRVRRPPDAVPLGLQVAQRGDPVERHRQPVHLGRGLRRGGPLHLPAAPPAGLPCRRRRADLRVAGRGRHVAGRVLGVAQHRLHPAPARCCSSSPTTATPSRCRRRTRRRRRWPNWSRASAACRSTGSTDATTSPSASRGPRPSPTCAPASGPALIHATVTRPYSHSAADTQTKYRSTDELADEAAHDPIKLLRAELVGAGILTEDEADADPRRGPPDRGRGGQGGAGAAAGPIRPR